MSSQKEKNNDRLIEEQIEILSDEIEERTAKIRALRAQLPPIDLENFFRHTRAAHSDRCTACGTRLDILNGLSDDGW